MFGFGAQEFLLLLMLALILFSGPGLFYILVWIGLNLLKSPRRVLVALWILNIAFALFKEAEGLNTIGVVILIVIMAILAPLFVAFQFAWLWLAGWLWQLVGWRHLGTSWREMAATHFRALKGAKKGAA